MEIFIVSLFFMDDKRLASNFEILILIQKQRHNILTLKFINSIHEYDVISKGSTTNPTIMRTSMINLRYVNSTGHENPSH